MLHLFVLHYIPLAFTFYHGKTIMEKSLTKKEKKYQLVPFIN